MFHNFINQLQYSTILPKIRHKHTLAHIILAQPKMVSSLITLNRTHQTSMAQLTTLITRNYTRASTNIINTTYMAKSLADITLYSLIRQRRETLIIRNEFQNSTNIYLNRYFLLKKKTLRRYERREGEKKP